MDGDCLNNWKPLLAKENSANLGLALRWEAGLAGMEGMLLLLLLFLSVLVGAFSAATCRKI